MENSALRLNDSESVLSLHDVEKYADGWRLSGEISQHSAATLAFRRIIIKNLLWFLKERKYTACGLDELRAFFGYLSHKKPEPGGRWGNPKQTKPLTPRTIKDYHGTLRTFFRWVIEEGYLTSSPMVRIPIPIDRADEVQPFSEEQSEALLAAAKKSRHPKRDEALLLTLLDTGMRASELCGLCMKDVDISRKTCHIREGKGGKGRTVYLGKRTSKALWNYLQADPRDDEDPVFLSERGEALTRNGLLQVIMRLGKAAGIKGTRCSPHTFRHTAAVMYLRNGGNQFSLMAMLGHTNIQMTARYVQLAEADVERQHRQFSPADGLKKGGKGK